MDYLALILLLAQQLHAQTADASFKLIKSQFGPSGKVIGTKLQLDEVRNRSSFRRTRR